MQAMRFLGIVLLVLGVGACAPQKLPGTPPKHVLLITVDTLRADHMSAWMYGRPTTFIGASDEDKLAGRDLCLDRLAEEGVMFQKAFAPRGMTTPSLASLMTGLTPLEHGVLTNGLVLDEGYSTLAESFAAAGFDTAGFSANRLVSKLSGLGQGFGTFETYHGEDRDLDAIRVAMGWLNERDLDAGPPIFLWLHLVGPHLPYDPLPVGSGAGAVTFKDRFVDPDYHGPANGSREFLDAAYGAGTPLSGLDVNHIVSLYDGEVARVAYLLRTFLQLYSGVYEDPAKRRLDDTLLVFASDHGEELYEHNGYWAHSKSVYSSVLHVPLFIRHPGSLTGRRVIDEIVTLEDIKPTLLEWFDLPPGDVIYGRSLLPLVDTYDEFEFTSRPAYGMWSDKILTVRAPKADGSGDWRLVWNPDKLEPNDTPPGAYPIPELALYDTAFDPKEQHDVRAEHPKVVEELLLAMQAWRAERQLIRRAELNSEQSKIAGELGYLDGTAEAPKE